MLGQYVVASLALLATSSMSASALRPEESIDVAGDLDDTLPSVEVSLHPLGDSGDLQDGISNTKDWRDFSGIPVTSAILTNDDNRAIVFSSYISSDRRDPFSFYAISSVEKHKSAVILSVVVDDGLVMQVVESRSHFKAGTDKFLSVHKHFSADSIYPGFVRVMAHSDAGKAAVWKKVTSDGKQYLQIKVNREIGSQSTVGWYLAEPPNSVRDELTNYLAVTPDIAKAMPVSFQAV